MIKMLPRYKGKFCYMITIKLILTCIQTVLSQIRLLHREQSDLGPNCFAIIETSKKQLQMASRCLILNGSESSKHTMGFSNRILYFSKILLWFLYMVDQPGFQVGPTFPIFPTFPYFFDLLLLFHENALLSLLFHSKLSFTRKNPEIFPHSLRSLVFYKLASMFIQVGCCLTPQFFNV